MDNPMTTFIISGSIDDSSGTSPAGKTYQTLVYGSLAVDDSRNPIAAIYNPTTGSLTLRKVRVSVAPQGNTVRNDVMFILGAVGSGSISGTAVTPTPLSPSYPAAAAACYKTPTGLPTTPSANGALVQAQSWQVNNGPYATPTAVITEQATLVQENVVLGPNYGYTVCLSELTPLTTPTWAFTVEFTHDE
jgi:hypothetical protein